MPRDGFRRRTVGELQAIPTVSSRTLDAPLDHLVEDLKLEDNGFRYSLIRDTRTPPCVPTRAAYREFDGNRWGIIPIYSISYLIDPMERAAIDANARGDRVVALLLIHALLEILMRSDQGADYGNRDGFFEVAKKFRDRLDYRALPGADHADLHQRLLAVNEKRNDVIHSLLVRYGLEQTNARLDPADFESWKATYDDTFHAVAEYLSL